MADDGHRADKQDAGHLLRYVRALLPRSADIVAALPLAVGAVGPDADEEHEVSPGNRYILQVAARLAEHHKRQWAAEDVSRRQGATDADVAASKRMIDGLNMARVDLVDQIDEWVNRRVHSRQTASMHTETLGSVVDRIAIAWVRSVNLAAAGPSRRARLALTQLAELSDSYDDLVRDLAAGQRRLPAWRQLKAYGGDS